MSRKKKTKILAIGDIHGDSSLVKKLAQQAEKEDVDLIILSGDLTWFGQKTKNIIKPFEKRKKPVLILHGNHETEDNIKALEEVYKNTRNLHGYYYKGNNFGIFGAGGVDWGTDKKEEENIFNALKKSHEKIKDSKKKIMVTHMHHFGSKSEFSGFPGSKAVAKAIKKFKPDILINSHIHEAGGIEEKLGKTLVFNVSRKPKIFEI
ncbi:metallophosphoesterase [Candidatus Pacearchaeota archaeon]|nr:metallophosphoesterase [Candidatus Pacearchaeota archaeon]